MKNMGSWEELKSSLTFFKNQFAILIWSVTAKIFLDISVFMIIYSNTMVPRCLSQPLNQTGFTHWGFSLN